MRAGFEASFEFEDCRGASSDADVAAAVDAMLEANDPADILVVGPMRHGEASYARLLEAGGAAFFLAEGVDTAKYGLGNATSFQWVFNPDVTTAAEKVAKEICRTTGFGYSHRVIKLYGAPYADVRVDANLVWLERYCGAHIHVVQEVRGLFQREIARAKTFSTLVRDSSVTTIIAANDRMVLGLLDAVEAALSPAKAAQLVVGGFDWTEDWMLKEGVVVASGDQSAIRAIHTFFAFGKWFFGGGTFFL